VWFYPVFYPKWAVFGIKTPQKLWIVMVLQYFFSWFYLCLMIGSHKKYYQIFKNIFIINKIFTFENKFKLTDGTIISKHNGCFLILGYSLGIKIFIKWLCLHISKTLKVMCFRFSSIEYTYWPYKLTSWITERNLSSNT